MSQKILLYSNEMLFRPNIGESTSNKMVNFFFLCKKNYNGSTETDQSLRKYTSTMLRSIGDPKTSQCVNVSWICVCLCI